MKTIFVLLAIVLVAVNGRLSVSEHVNEISERFFNQTLTADEIEHVNYVSEQFLPETSRRYDGRNDCPREWVWEYSTQWVGSGSGSDCSCNRPCAQEWRAGMFESIRGQLLTVTYNGRNGETITEYTCECKHCGLFGVLKPASITSSLLGLVNVLLKPVYTYFTTCACDKNGIPGSDFRSKCKAIAACVASTTTLVTTNGKVKDLFAIAWNATFGEDSLMSGWRGARAAISRLPRLFVVYMWTCFSYKFANTWAKEAAAVGVAVTEQVELIDIIPGNIDPNSEINQTRVDPNLSNVITNIIDKLGNAAVGAVIDFLLGLVWKFVGLALTGPAAGVVMTALLGEFVWDCRDAIFNAGRAAFNILRSLVTCNGGGITFEGLLGIFIDLAQCYFLSSCRSNNRSNDAEFESNMDAFMDARYNPPLLGEINAESDIVGALRKNEVREMLEKCDSDLCSIVLPALDSLDSIRNEMFV